ncbi:hypothetical protein KPH14_011855, partial [Odynerus spinipes]
RSRKIGDPLCQFRGESSEPVFRFDQERALSLQKEAAERDALAQKEVALENRLRNMEIQYQVLASNLTDLCGRLPTTSDGAPRDLSFTNGGASVNTAPSRPIIPLPSVTTTSNIDLGYSVKPAKFDGNSSWEEYKIQFQTIARINGWDEPRKSLAWVSSLEGSARSVLTTLFLDKHTDWNALVLALEFKYGAKNLANLSYVMFQNYKQRRGQSLSDSASAQNAFSDCPLEMRDKLAASQFVSALADEERKRTLRLGGFTSLRAAVVRAIEFEAVESLSSETRKVNTRTWIPPEREITGRGWYSRGRPQLEKTTDRTNERRPLECWSCERLPILGRGLFKIEFGNFTGKEDFLLVDMLEECIMGTNFFSKHLVQLDFSTSELRIPGQKGIHFKNGNQENRVEVVPSEVSELMPIHLQALFERSSKSLSKDQRTSFAAILKEFADVFARDSGQVGQCDLVQHKVNTQGHVPTKQAPRRLPFHRRAEVEELLAKMEEQGVIEKSKSPWSSPIVLVKKKDGSMRKFVKSFSSIAKPLHRLTEDKASFLWTEECQQAFEQLKKCLAESPVLAYPLTNAEFILDTDASNFAMGADLSQVQDGQEMVVAFFSKTLNKAERNYCVTRKELLAIVKSIEHFQYYLYRRSFTVRTDHAALRWLLSFKKPEGQIARWIERLQGYDFKIEHRPGRIHSNADALSRRPCEESQSSKPTWQEISAQSSTTKYLWKIWDSLEIKHELLFRRWESADGKEVSLLLVVPKAKVEEILKECHDSPTGGHFGVKKTLAKVRQRFFWLSNRTDVEDWCRRCFRCSAKKGPKMKGKGALKIYNVGAPFERIALDIVGPLPKSSSGNRYGLVVVDYFSKWLEVVPLLNQQATTIAKALVREVISRHGVPLELHSDQGRSFESSIFKELMKILGIKKTRTTPLHPQSDGLVERTIRTLLQYLTQFVAENQKDWDEWLPMFLLAYRSLQHEVTRHTPSMVLMGRDLRLPVDLVRGKEPERKEESQYVEETKGRIEKIHRFVRRRMKMCSARMKTWYDASSKPVSFEPGQEVWLYNPRRVKGKCPKLQTDWEGPYIVRDRLNELIYRIVRSLKSKPRVVHVNRLAGFESAKN